MGRAAAVGISARDLLAASPTEFVLLMEASRHAGEYLDARDENLARRIINDLAESMKKR